MKRWLFVLAAIFASAASGAAADKRPPNVVVLFCDDLGYGDLGCYGHPTIRTPELDRMAAEGIRFTQFYSAAPVCTPSRAALLTGRLPIRNGMAGSKQLVIFPPSEKGLPAEEITIAEALKPKGYATMCIGKWHLGHQMPYRPLRHGFDRYYGLMYSNDMKPVELFRDDEMIEFPVKQATLTERYTAEAIQFIQNCRKGEGKPFFLYLPYTMPHTPIFASEKFAGKSKRGLYGDVVETIDWSVGQILKTLRDNGLAENTIVFFSSDNGPWLIQKQNGGSAGLLREGKGSTWEGGVREPGIVWWPGRIKPAVTTEIGSTMDIFTTSLTLAGAELPTDRVIDGKDLSPVLFGAGPSQTKVWFYYRGPELTAVRKGPWKIHFKTQPGFGQKQPLVHNPPLLFHLENDPSETHDVGKQHADVIAELVQEAEKHRAELKPVPPQY